jgi:hypothetical protein
MACMTGARLKHIRQDLLNLTLEEMGATLKPKLTGEGIRQREEKPRVDASCLTGLLKAFPEHEAEIRLYWEGKAGAVDYQSIKRANSWRQANAPKNEGPFAAEAALWATSFRTRFLLDRLAFVAGQAGLGTSPLPGGLLLCQPTSINASSGNARNSRVFFPYGGRFGLHAGTALLLAAPDRNPLTGEVVQLVCAKLRVEIEPRVRLETEFWFGYRTCWRDFRIEQNNQGRVHRPGFRLDAGGAPCYEDVGLVLYAPLEEIGIRGKEPFGKAASRVIVAMGAHRLATGVALRLLEDLDVREELLQKHPRDFEAKNALGLLCFKVEVRVSPSRTSPEGELTVVAFNVLEDL